MAKKEPVDIELKEISVSYPSLQDESEVSEERKSSRSLRPQPRNLPMPPPSSSLPSSTPIVPITSPAAGVSFTEQQRLRNSAPVQTPIVPAVSRPPSGIISPMYPTAGFRIINCSGCRGMIQYPASVMIVCCTACHATTATRPLVSIVCYYCRHSAYYPADQVRVTCRCGTVYAISPAY